MKTRIIQCLKVVKGEGFSHFDNIITEGWLDSFELLRFIKEIESEFEVKIPLSQINVRSFDSLEAITSTIEYSIQNGKNNNNTVNGLHLSKIDGNFKIYRDSRVILIGNEKLCAKVLDELNSMDIMVYGYHATDGKNGIANCLCMDEQAVRNACENSYIVQICDIHEDDEISWLKSNNIDNYITYSEYSRRVDHIALYQGMSKCNMKYVPDNVIDRSFPSTYEVIAKTAYLKKKYCNIICMPPKTGDVSIYDALRKSEIEVVNSWHDYSSMLPLLKMLDKNSIIRIISAVRNPIAQNISSFFQALYMMWETKLFWENGGSIQGLFDLFIRECTDNRIRMATDESIMDNEIISVPFKVLSKKYWLIQDWFDNSFLESTGIDVYKYPFDVDKGYTIIKEGKIEIFIYQIEKLDSLADELSEFIGENVVIRKVNSAEDKWYRDIYSNAQKHLKVSSEYFSWCMDSKILEHFYSKADKELIYQRWSNNL